VAIEPPLPPRMHDHDLGAMDERFVRTYFQDVSAKKLVYSTFDWGIRDKDGYYFILGRTDDVINVAGHRPRHAPRSREAVSMHPNVAVMRRGRRRRPSQRTDAARFLQY